MKHPELFITFFYSLTANFCDKLSNPIDKEISGSIYAINTSYTYLKLFYRDDIRRELHLATQTDLPFSIEGKTVILIDDVLFTGRTIRAALDALLAFGRPSKVTLCVLVDRKASRELPIQPDFAGKEMIDDSPYKVKVRWKENDGVDDVILLVD